MKGTSAAGDVSQQSTICPGRLDRIVRLGGQVSETPILYVDDEPDHADILKLALRGWGYSVTHSLGTIERVLAKHGAGGAGELGGGALEELLQKLPSFDFRRDLGARGRPAVEDHP
jgi:hypothetical protein